MIINSACFAQFIPQNVTALIIMYSSLEWVMFININVVFVTKELGKKLVSGFKGDQ